MEQGTAKKTKSCTRAIIWLSRSINFSKYLLERLLKTPESSLEEIVEEAYGNTLKPWHGWISSAAYKVSPEHLFLIFFCLQTHLFVVYIRDHLAELIVRWINRFDFVH
jgi:hypothetical protein